MKTLIQIIKSKDIQSAVIWFLLAFGTYLISSQGQVANLIDAMGVSPEAATAIAVSIAGFAQIVTRKIRNEMSK